MTTPGGEDGFSLIEALVALLILAISTVGLIRASEAHVDSIRGLELRTAAQWVAENRLVELGLPGNAAPAGAEIEMLGGSFRVSEVERPTDDAEIRAVRVTATPAGGGPGVTLDGFRDTGGAP